MCNSQGLQDIVTERDSKNELITDKNNSNRVFLIEYDLLAAALGCRRELITVQVEVTSS